MQGNTDKNRIFVGDLGTFLNQFSRNVEKMIAFENLL